MMQILRDNIIEKPHLHHFCYGTKGVKLWYNTLITTGMKEAMMTVLVERETIHQLIDDLSERQLLEVARFIEFLLSGVEKSVELSDEADRDVPAEDNLVDLNGIIQVIKNTPPNAQAITLPAKTWTEYAAEITEEADVSLDVAAWNKNWDVVETEMEASSLAHEEIERQE
jgi:hypothetical protein